MGKIKSLQIASPILKVNNREHNLTFYRGTLGFKVTYEENAFADLGGAESSKTRLTLEESPSMRTRKVEGKKKLAQVSVFVPKADEIETLLARGVDYDRLYRGANGWAFEAVSPEGDRFLLHSETEADSLEVVSETPNFTEKVADFTYLSDFKIDKVTINVSPFSQQQAFYQDLFEDASILEFQTVEGADLSLPNDVTWDLSGFNLDLPEGTSLLDLASHLSELGVNYFMTKKANFLTFKDKSELDLFYRP